MIWKKKSKIWKLQLSVKDFNLFIKKCYPFVLSLEENRESKYPKPVKTKNRRIMPPSKFVVCDDEKLRFINTYKLADY